MPNYAAETRLVTITCSKISSQALNTLYLMFNLIL